MRRRDENKREAIFRATKELLNEIGFSQVSMSKIAARAGVSAATIYIYFENKDDMLKKLYLDVKQHMMSTVMAPFEADLPARQMVEQAMRGYLSYILNHREDYLFMEQFSNSPLLENLCIEEEVPSLGRLHAVIEDAVRSGLLKPVNEQLMMAYCYLPLSQLVKDHFKSGAPVTEQAVQTVLDMSWDAIKA